METAGFGHVRDMTLAEKPRILVVDDEEVILRSLARLLRREFEVETAPSPSEALKTLDRFRPAIVLSDYSMPEMTGTELLSEIGRRQPASLRLILSGHADSRSIRAAIDDGVLCRLIAKPWDNMELVTLLKALLAERRFVGVGRGLLIPLAK